MNRSLYFLRMEAFKHFEDTRHTPLFRLDRLSLSGNRTILVVRDDLLPAGTKQRAILPLLQEFLANGITELTYASPFAGFAQVALAYGCHALNLRCTLFCESDPSLEGTQAHMFTKLAESWGAKIVLVKSLSAAEREATAFAASREAYKIPLGFQCREFQKYFQAVVQASLDTIRQQLGYAPARAWLPIGSGTLAQAFHRASPAETHLCCVDVHVLPMDDLRIQSLRALPRIQYYSAKEEFREKARQPPPIPSNIHYDAKIWALVSEYAKDGDLWWNVAR